MVSWVTSAALSPPSIRRRFRRPPRLPVPSPQLIPNSFLLFICQGVAKCRGAGRAGRPHPLSPVGVPLGVHGSARDSGFGRGRAGRGRPRRGGGAGDPPPQRPVMYEFISMRRTKSGEAKLKKKSEKGARERNKRRNWICNYMTLRRGIHSQQITRFVKNTNHKKYLYVDFFFLFSFKFKF